jgi:hypothetical protein
MGMTKTPRAHHRPLLQPSVLPLEACVRVRGGSPPSACFEDKVAAFLIQRLPKTD